MMWTGSFKNQGYYFRQVGAVTILIGLYMHVTRAFIGDDLLLAHVFTPTFDRVLTVPMVYAAVTGLMAWRHIPFRGVRDKVRYGIVLFYVAGSVPLHVYNVYLHDSTEYIRFFPMWFSYLLFPIYGAIIWILWRLPYDGGERQAAPAQTPLQARR